MQEEWLMIKALDQHQFDLLYFPNPSAKSGIVLLHEIFGLTPFITRMCQLWQNQGYQVVAPALYDRHKKNLVIEYTRADLQQALAEKQKAVNWHKQLLDIDASKKYLLELGCSKIATLGYSWGGTLSWLSACRLSDITCSISYYGTHILSFNQEQPHCPCLWHVAEKDNLVPINKIKKLAASKPEVTLFQYSATHAFRTEEWQDSAEQTYDKTSAIKADQNSQEFFSTYLSQK